MLKAASLSKKTAKRKEIKDEIKKKAFRGSIQFRDKK